MTIKSQCYGGGFRWYCTECDVDGYTIHWTNSTPPILCKKCSVNNETNQREAARAAIKYLKDKYQERAVFPGSIRAIANLCEKHNILPNGMPKTHFAKLINEESETCSLS